MNTEQIVTYLTNHKQELHDKYSVSRLGLFGSHARGDMYSDSDIDIVVELEEPDIFALIGIKQQLEDQFCTKVDIVRLRDRMNQSLRTRIEKDAIYV
ncbi:MAG: nucleotidyltransferase family protein [Desulfuromusa sp.]|nr:nucleotidyltransferase family protein [Desulfuromusa sp.]